MSSSKEQATSMAMSQTMHNALVAPAEIQLGPASDVLPAGIQGAVLYGDPTAPGVLAILTHHNMPRMNPPPWSHLRPQGKIYLPVQDDKAVELPPRMWGAVILNCETKAAPCAFEIAICHCIKPAQRANFIIGANRSRGDGCVIKNRKTPTSHIKIRN